MEIKLVETGVDNPDFVKLVEQLDSYYYDRFREIVLNYQEHHKLSTMQCAVVAYADGTPVGCGAFRLYKHGYVEMKRIFVADSHRRMGLATQIMQRLEEIAVREGNRCAILETGVEMKDAILFYQKIGYTIVPNFGTFENDDICICLAKQLVPDPEPASAVS